MRYPDQSADAKILRHTHVTSTDDVIPINDVTIKFLLLKQLKYRMAGIFLSRQNLRLYGIIVKETILLSQIREDKTTRAA